MPAKKITATAYNFNKQIGKRITLLRKVRNLQLKDFCKELKVTLNQAFLYEQGKGDIKVSRLKDIARVLGVSIYELFPAEEGQDYQPIPEDCLQLLNYLISNNIDIKEVYDIIKEYKTEEII